MLMATERSFAENLDKINVLQVGHHGSKTSTGEILLVTDKTGYSLNFKWTMECVEFSSSNRD